MMVLRSGVHEPDSVKNYADVSDFLNRYDLNLDEFIAAGGTRPSDIELKQAVQRGRLTFGGDKDDSLSPSALQVMRGASTPKTAV